MATIAFLLAILFLQDSVECVNQCVSKFSPYFRGYYMKAEDCPGATLRNSTLVDANIVCCIFDTAMIPSIPKNINISIDAYLHMVGDTTRTRSLYPFYMQALSTAGILSKQEIAAFTAQILYQTSGMNFSEENSNGEEYKGIESLGNSRADDPRKYISRGFLPLIGRHMYRLAKLSVNSKIIRQPEMVALPSIGFQVAAWLWRNGYSSHDNSSLPTGELGKYCNGTEYSFVELSYSIQKNTAGIEKLFKYWRHTAQVLGLPCPSEGKGPVCSSGNRRGRCKLATSCKGEFTNEGCPASSPIACCLDCQHPVDLAFVLDSSGSVKPADFRLGLEFIIEVCEYFNIEYPHGTRVALIRYSSLPKIIFRFNTFVKKEDLLNAIRETPYQKGSTRTDLALIMAHEVLFGNSNNGVRAKELGVPRVLVLLTDGRSTSGIDAVVNSSKLLRREGVSVFAIGIGKNINKQELNIIASEPAADHVTCPKTFAEINSMVEKMREASCYEPALLEGEKEVMLSVQQNSVKYYKYDLQNATGIKTLFLETSYGRGDFLVSMWDKNPRNYHLNLGLCKANQGNKPANQSNLFELEDLEGSDFCNVNEDGGCTEPCFVSNAEFMEEGMIVYVRKCSSRWFYVSVEGINKTNTFNLTLFKDFIRSRTANTPESPLENATVTPENKTATFPIPENVYVGVAVATIGTTATVAAAVTLSCAKEFQLKGSTKIKKKKRKNQAKKNNETAINKGFEGDDDVLVSVKTRSSLTPLIDKHENIPNGGSSGNVIDKENDITEKEAIRSIYVAEVEANSTNKTRKSSCSTEDQKRKRSLQTVTIANTNTGRRPTPHPQMSLVSSMIHDLQREDTFIEETVTSVTPGPEGEDTRVKKTARIKRQITSKSVSVSVDTPQESDSRNFQSKDDRFKKIGAQMMRRNCDMLLTEAKENTQSDLTNRMDYAVNGCKGKNKGFSKNLNNGSLGENNSSLIQPSKSSQLIENDWDQKTTCCFHWRPSLSSNKVKRSSKTEEDLEKTDLEKNSAEVGNDEKEGKSTLLRRLRAKLTWRNVLAVLCPCFTYYILEKEKAKIPADNEKDESEKGRCELRDSRFERDMQMSQTFCVLFSQLLFVAGADAKDHKIGCAVVAITMNYLSLVTVSWLIVQALYLFSFTKQRDNETKQRMKINLYYAGTWGLPLFAVVILASKYDSYNKHPHCWISFSDALSWSVATPMISLALVQVILIILLIKALVTYRKSGNAVENEERKSVIKSGLKTVVCITITVIVTWLLGSLSLNIDRDVYHMFFTIFNALQGFLFFLFYVVLNPQVRQLVLVVWQFKESSVTPFDEHQAIEIEEEKEKDKKKGKGKGKGKSANEGKKGDKNEIAKEDEFSVKAVQNVAGAGMAAASTVNNSKVIKKENVEEKKGTRKISWVDGPSGNVPVKKLPPISQQQKTAASNQKIQKDPASKGKAKDFPSSLKDKHLRSPSPTGQQSRTLPHQKKKTTQFELKDKLSIAAFSSPPAAHPKAGQKRLAPITTTQQPQSQRIKVTNQKSVGKKKTIKVKKS